MIKVMTLEPVQSDIVPNCVMNHCEDTGQPVIILEDVMNNVPDEIEGVECSVTAYRILDASYALGNEVE